MKKKTHLLMPLIFAGGEEPGYYVDQTGGNDANGGESSGDAWKTIAKVNGVAFNPGDNIFFKRGETWAEELVVPSSGTSGNQIVFGAYDYGARPIIDGGGARGNCIDVDAQDYITIQDIEVKDSTTINLDGNGDTLNLILKRVKSTGGTATGIWFDTGGGEIIDCEIGTAGAWSLVINTSGAYIIRNTNITAGLYGMLLRGSSTGTAEGCTITGVTGEFGFSIGGTGGWTLTNCVAHTCAHASMVGFRLGDSATHNYIDCVAYGMGGDGFDNRGDGTMICTRCLAYNNGTLGSENSGDGYTSHIAGGSLVLNYCIAYGNTKSGVAVAGGDLTAYNCTFYANNDEAGVGWVSNLGIGVSTVDGTVTIRNCITQGHEFEVYVHDTAVPGITLDFDYNCFYDSEGGDAFHYDGTDYNWADWKTQSGGDANSLNENPFMVAPATDNFHLQGKSPCRDVGTDVGLTEDFDEVTVPQETNPAIGAYEPDLTQSWPG